MTDAHEWGPGEIVGGHRLLRRLGHGRSAEVWLAAPAVAEDGERVALKLIRPGEAGGRAAQEAEALWRARGPHVVRLRDVVPVASGAPFLLLDAVPHELHTVLASGLGPGAAVTLLVPIAQTLARLHALGVTHGGVRLAAVGLDSRGSPVLLGFGAAEIGPVSPERRTGDCAAFAALALVVLAAIDEREREAGWHRLVAWLGASHSGAEHWLADCVERCYDYAEPQPVALASAEPLSTVMLAAVGRDPAPAPQPSASPSRDVWGRMRELAQWRPARLGRRVAARAGDTASSATGVRARFWVPAAIAGAGLLAVLLVPATGSADAAELSGPEDIMSSPPSPTPEAIRIPTTSPPAPLAPTMPAHAAVVDELGGAFIVALDGPRGPEQLVLVAVDDGWEVREYFPVDELVPDAGQVPSTPAKSPPSRRDFTAPRKRAASAPSMIR